MMGEIKTHMRAEIEEIPHAIERMLVHAEQDINAAAQQIRANPPRFLISVARGSSDHACTYLKYASELLLQLPMCSMGPSVASLYGVSIQAENSLSLAVSQSGQSPDILSMVQSNRDSGALTIAITNNIDSPLANAANICIPTHTGEERSVAATKTFVTSVVAGLWLFAELKNDTALMSSIRSLPEFLDKAAQCDWSEAISAINESSLFTLGRGPGWAISNEAALKFKETCQIHAESYSSAEVLHGPVSIVERGFPVIGFAANDVAESSLISVCDTLSEKGATVFVTSDLSQHATRLPHVRTEHWLTDPLSAVVSFYSMVEQLSRSLDINPDTPRHLHKVTETL